MSVQARRGVFYVSSFSAAGPIRVGNGWVEAISEDAEDVEIGNIIVAAMAQSRTDAQVPDFRNSDSPSAGTQNAMNLAGVKTFSAFLNGLRMVKIERSPGAPTVSVIPYEKSDRHGNFVPITANRVELAADIDPTGLAKAVRASFTVAR